MYRTSSRKTTTKAIVSKIFNFLKKIPTTIKKNFHNDFLRTISGKMTFAQLKTNGIVTSGASSIWLSSLTLKIEGFSLTKRKFFGLIYLLYGWEPKNLPKQ